jgi:hypothetical protein
MAKFTGTKLCVFTQITGMTWMTMDYQTESRELFLLRQCTHGSHAEHFLRAGFDELK